MAGPGRLRAQLQDGGVLRQLAAEQVGLPVLAVGRESHDFAVTAASAPGRVPTPSCSRR